MPDLTTWQVVADNAVKIGLGALIGGGLTILGTWQSHKLRRLSELEKEKREKLEKILKDFESFNSIFNKYWSDLAVLIDKKEDNKRITDKELESLNELRSNLYESFSIFNSCRAMLLLIGADNIEKKMTAFGIIADDLFEKLFFDSEECNSQFLNKEKQRIEKVRPQVYLAFQSEYKKGV